MSAIPNPISFSSGTVISPTQVNTNFAAINSVVNGGLDTSNVNAAVGIGANCIVASGTGGASGAFQDGAYSFSGAVNSGGPVITVDGTGIGPGEVFEVKRTDGVIALEVDAVTGFVTIGALNAGLSVAGKGQLQTTSDNATLAPVPPCYTLAGAPVAAGAHFALGTFVAAATSTTVTLAGAAAFTTFRGPIFVRDVSTNPYTAPSATTADTLNASTFATVVGHTYTVFVLGV